jgi:hypothetical protein
MLKPATPVPAAVLIVPSRHFAHAMPFELGDVQVAHRIEDQVSRGHQLRGCGGSAIAVRALLAVAGDGGDEPVGGDLAHLLVAEIGDIEVAGCVQRQAVGRIELSQIRRTAVAEVAGMSVAGEGGDDAGRGDFADAVIVGVGQVEVALAVDGDAVRVRELGGGSGAAVAHQVAAGGGID